MNVRKFNTVIRDFYSKNRRDLEWRSRITPYRVVVSEIMLQQTQVTRVAVKFPQFIAAFPDFKSLGRAAVAEVLGVWQGMGYNRRALYLKKIAEIIIKDYEGRLPSDPDVLETFPGIGHATARSIVTFTYNRPEIFIETNIRRVFIHFFFDDKTNISDKEIFPLVEKAIDRKNPRMWYYALMDYGTILGKTVQNPNRRSRHYVKQSAFEGSERKIRGMILRTLLQEKRISKNLLRYKVQDERFNKIINGLINEGFIKEDGTGYSIA